jgi:hypothetical protein
MAAIQLRSLAKAASSVRGKLEIIRRRHEEVTVRDWVKEQFPEFIQSDYPRMIEFIQAYYSYISTKTENGEIDDIRDIDFTSGDYLLKIRKEFSYNATKFNFLSEPEFIRHAKEFYASKGSEESIKFLFRALFNDDVEIEYPSDRLFTPSNAHWEQFKSIKVQLKQNSITPDNFIGSYLTLRNSDNIRQIIEIDDVKDLTVKIDQDEVSVFFEIFTQTDIYIDVQIGDILLGDDFEATVVPSLASVNILNQGNNFRVGQVVKLDGAVGTGGVGIISSVTNTGGIKNIKLIQFGKNYTGNFYVNVKPEGVFADAGQTFESSGDATYNIGITDLQNTYEERLNVLESDYVLNDSPGAYPFYVASAYIGEYKSQGKLLQTFYADEQIYGLLYCSIGPIAKYPGKFRNTVGAPSDYSVVQDGEYYQSFSYKIKSRYDINEYRDAITTFAHPAGLKMFSEYSVEDRFDTEATIKLVEVENPVLAKSDWGYLYGNLQINVKAEGVFPQGNDLVSAPTNNYAAVTNSVYLTELNNLAYTSQPSEESVKVYATGALKMKG